MLASLSVCFDTWTTYQKFTVCYGLCPTLSFCCCIEACDVVKSTVFVVIAVASSVDRDNIAITLCLLYCSMQVHVHTCLQYKVVIFKTFICWLASRFTVLYLFISCSLRILVVDLVCLFEKLPMVNEGLLRSYPWLLKDYWEVTHGYAGVIANYVGVSCLSHLVSNLCSKQWHWVCITNILPASMHYTIHTIPTEFLFFLVLYTNKKWLYAVE